jgi:uncharacterized membrane protein YdjX (TVP38/TMEM64 family)
MKRALPLLLLILLALAAWLSGVTDYLTWEELARQQLALRRAVANQPVLMPVLFVAIYAGFVALSLPQAVVVTITGGMLFGPLLGGALAVTGATIGATILFLLARSAFGATLATRGGPFLQKVRDELARDGFNYLLAIRLIPVFPFWLVNLAAALCGMRLLSYVTATLIGIAPGTFVFASIGAGVGTVLATGGRPDLSIILSWPVLGPLLGLAALSLLPIAWRRWKKPNA